MNYYPHHIGDFNNATRHLNRLERSIYRDLIELYYENESELPLDVTVLCRKIIARSNEELTAVEQVLNEFFIQTPTGWFHLRCDDEIEHYRNSQSQKAEAGRASAAKRQAKKQQAINGTSTDVEQALNVRSTDAQQTNNGALTNQEPRTKNQEPIITTHTEAEDIQPFKPSMAAAVCVLMKSEGVGSVNPQNPNLKKLLDAGAEIGMFAEAVKIAKDRQKGFAYVLGIVDRQLEDAKRTASEIKPSDKPAYETNYQRTMRERVEEMAPGVARRAPEAFVPFTNFLEEVNQNVITIGSN